MGKNQQFLRLVLCFGQLSVNRSVLNVVQDSVRHLCYVRASFWQKRSGGQIKHERGKWMLMCFTLFVALSPIFTIIKVSLWCKPFAANVVSSIFLTNMYFTTYYPLMETAILVIFQECRLFHWETLMGSDWSLNGLLLPCMLQRASECSCIVVIYAASI